MKALATESHRHRGKAFFIFSVSASKATFFHSKDQVVAVLVLFSSRRKMKDSHFGLDPQWQENIRNCHLSSAVAEYAGHAFGPGPEPWSFTAGLGLS